MKFFVTAIFIGTLLCQVIGAPVENAEVESTNIESRESAPVHDLEGSDNVRFRKAVYGGGPAKPAYAGVGPAISYTYPSPAPTVPCGRNLVFSCQPSVAPVPCSAPAPPPVYAGAYSEPVPQWVYPNFY